MMVYSSGDGKQAIRCDQSCTMVLAIPRRSRTSAGILTGVQTTAFSAFPKAVCLSPLEFPLVAPMFRCAWPS